MRRIVLFGTWLSFVDVAIHWHQILWCEIGRTPSLRVGRCEMWAIFFRSSKGRALTTSL